MAENEPTNTPGLLIPIGTALNIADMAESMVDDARKLATEPSEASAEDLLMTMRLLHQRLSAAFRDLDIEPGASEEMDTVIPISSAQTDAATALADMRQQIIDSGDLAGCLAIESQRRRALEATVIELTNRVNDLANRIS